MSEPLQNRLDALKAQNIYDLRGVVAVVTGGGSGIGLMISSTLLANGATVYIVGPDQTKLDNVVKAYNAAMEQGSGKMVGLQADIRLKEEAKRLADELAQREGYVTVLFNNAGIIAGSIGDRLPPGSNAQDFFDRMFEVEPEVFDNVLRTNSVSAYYMSVAFLPLLEKWKLSEHGRRFAPQIIMTSSMNGWTKDLDTSGRSFPYSMSKSAIGHFTSSLATELIPLGIRVNGIAPGLFVTEMSVPGAKLDSAFRVILPPDITKEYWGLEVPAEQPDGSFGGSTRDVGSLAMFLLANWFVNGETVLIDGGTMLKHASSY